jgi:hypothetical protein
MKLFLAAPWSGLPSALTALLPQASRLQRKGGVRSELALPDHSDRPFFAWSFLALEVGSFKANWLFGLNGIKWDALGGRTSCASRPSASNRIIKISASIATTYGSKRPNSDGPKLHLFL